MSLPPATRAATRPQAITALAAAAAITITAGVAAAPAARADDPFPLTAVISYGIARDQLHVQYHDGWEAVTGPAAKISDIQALAASVRTGTLAEYTGPSETGTGILIFTGDDDATVAFQVNGATVASADNQTDQAWYICDGCTDAIIVPGATADIRPTYNAISANVGVAPVMNLVFLTLAS